MFERGDPRLRKWISHANEMLVPLIAIGELRAGFAAGSRQTQNEELLRGFLDLPNVTTVTISDTTTVMYSRIFSQLRRVGKPIGSNDMWIAAIALEHKLPVLTLDADFSNIQDLVLLKLEKN